MDRTSGRRGGQAGGALAGARAPACTARRARALSYGTVGPPAEAPICSVVLAVDALAIMLLLLLVEAVCTNPFEACKYHSTDRLTIQNSMMV